MTGSTRNDFNTFRQTLPPLLNGDYRIWPRWRTDHLDYLFQLTFEAVARGNCGVEERLRARWDDRDATFAFYLRSFAHEGLASGSPRGEMLSFALPGVETASVVREQLGNATVVLFYNPAGLALARLAVPTDDHILAIAADDTWAGTVRRLLGRADLVVLAASVMTGGVRTELTLLREAHAQERTVILLAEPPDRMTVASHEWLHRRPLDRSAPRAGAGDFADFPWVVDGWDARDPAATAALTPACQGALDAGRPDPVGDPPELPSITVDKATEARALEAIALGVREADTGRAERAVLRFTAAVYTGYEACSIPAMLAACAQLAHWSAELGAPLANDYRQLHALFAVGAEHGFAAMAARYQRWLSTG
ncbi:hypothetical protein GCM10020358_59910 [Amorphoplanes nipponensis]|uniref:Uncharacterized protein n=1 Tax=Actinoplanes nipponensis TaxID=135950 RepID=A0A919MEZ4_9ACTN|nr:hypothetical protein [Actinoplanes nipponensis]GIE46969.1 hypothetical protein Ani05nite_05030 [Actinoplanes nipponensis]